MSRPTPEQPDRREIVLPILAFLGLSTVIVVTGLSFHRHYEQQYRAGVERQLAAIAKLKVNEVRQWREERLADAGGFSSNPAFLALVRQALAPPGDAEALRLLHGWIEGHQRHEDYSRIALLDDRGVERLSAPAAAPEPDFTLSRDLGAVLQTRRVAMLDFRRSASGSGIRLGLVVPLFERTGPDRLLGVLVMSMDPLRQLLPSLLHWPIPSSTAEILLVRREGNEAVFLNELRFRKDAALTLRIPLERKEVPAVAAVLGHQGSLEGIDYRGVRVVADTRAVPDSPWFIVVRMDLAEVYAPLRERLRLMLALIAALLLVAGSGSGLLWRRRTLQLYRERLAAEGERSWLRTVIARSLNEIYVFDAATLRFSFVNEGACRNLGYTLEELLALTPLDIKPRIDAAAFAALVQPLREGTLPVLAFETAHRRQDGSEYPVEAHLQLIDSGRGEVFLAVINDITERTRAEGRLRLNEARLESLLEIAEHESRSEQQLLDFALHKTLALTGSAHGYIYLYREGTRQFVLNSWSRGVMDACTVAEPQALYELDKTGIWGEAVRQRRPILVNDFSAHHPLKKGYPAGHVPLRNFLTVPIFSGFEIVAVVGVANKEGDYDASDMVQLSLLMESVWRVVERSRAEAALAERNAEMERFIYTVSHDLKSPLVTVKTFLGYLEEDVARADRVRIDKDLHFMRTAADKMGRLLDDLLEMSRIGRVAAEPVVASFADLAGEAVALVAGRIAERGAVVHIDPADVTLRGDRTRLVEIWQNLVENAVKFMGDQPAPGIRIGAGRREGSVVFFVSDNGSGFDPRYREKIFGLFERLDPAIEGTGLGLALVKRIVELYGGTIAADSDGPGRGAAITFTLPGALVKPEPETR